MGSKRESGVFWCLLLAGLLLLAAASAAEARWERDTKKEDIQWCKKDCAWKFGQDSRKVKDCKEHCEHRHSPGGRLPEDIEGDEPNSNGHGQGEGEGEGERCRQQCERYPRGSYGREQCIKDCKSTKQADGEGMTNHHEAGCKEECKRRYGHGYERQQCVRDCESTPHHGGGGGAGGRGRKGDERQPEHGWEMRVAGAVLQAV